MPTLEEIRSPVLAQIKGCLTGTVDMDPDPLNGDAARSLISGRLFDGEKLADAFGGQYFWIPRYGDAVRVEDRGYRTRFTSVLTPPTTGSYKLTLYGYGVTNALSPSSSAAAIASAIHGVSPSDLAATEVTKNADGSFSITTFLRVGMSTSAGSLLSTGGMGICLMNRDFTVPLPKGTRWYSCPKLPFVSDDETNGIHDCINLALNDVYVDDLFPVTATLPWGQRPTVIQLSELAPWLLPEHVLGYYAPTDWAMTAVFVPPPSGSYTLTLGGWKDFASTAPILSSATGAQIEAALAAIPGIGQPPTVEPIGAATSFTIQWQTQYYKSTLTPSAGYIAMIRNDRLREPFPTTIGPYYRADFESPTVGDPGYVEGATWFINCRRPYGSKIAPQTYPLNANGIPDTTKPPIKGTEWVESSSGLVNDLDQTAAPIERVVLQATRYVFEAIADASPRGESQEWTEKAKQMGAQSAGRIIWGKSTRRGPGRSPIYPGAALGASGAKSWIWW